MVYSIVTCIRPLRIASFSVQRMIKARFITAFLIYVKMPILLSFSSIVIKKKIPFLLTFSSLKKNLSYLPNYWDQIIYPIKYYVTSMLWLRI